MNPIPIYRSSTRALSLSSAAGRLLYNDDIADAYTEVHTYPTREAACNAAGQIEDSADSVSEVCRVSVDGKYRYGFVAEFSSDKGPPGFHFFHH